MNSCEEFILLPLVWVSLSLGVMRDADPGTLSWSNFLVTPRRKFRYEWLMCGWFGDCVEVASLSSQVVAWWPEPELEAWNPSSMSIFGPDLSSLLHHLVVCVCMAAGWGPLSSSSLRLGALFLKYWKNTQSGHSLTQQQAVVRVLTPAVNPPTLTQPQAPVAGWRKNPEGQVCS